MNVFGRIAACLPDDHPVAILVPLEHRARADAQPLAHLRGNRDLTLRRDLRMCKRHELYYHGNEIAWPDPRRAESSCGLEP